MKQIPQLENDIRCVKQKEKDLASQAKESLGEPQLIADKSLEAQHDVNKALTQLPFSLTNFFLCDQKKKSFTPHSLPRLTVQRPLKMCPPRS